MATKQNIEAAIPNPLLYGIWCKNRGLSHIWVWEVLSRLLKSWGNIDHHDLIKNRHRLNDGWEHEDPFAKFVECMEQVQEFATAGLHLIATENILVTIYAAIFNTGEKLNYCVEWGKKKDMDKMWTIYRPCSPWHNVHIYVAMWPHPNLVDTMGLIQLRMVEISNIMGRHW